ncbi:aminotransferase class V-fold PLP-dependent enzyme [Rhizohabitans arisaemae]|uniref:aminotransferase class V-fold PLP-dependent enzyme n=1 Tax=Rhizohabitans arisaemae TaxID=2720610 RepID=UPI0024B0B29C|nr:aminotransferase class V-fold PLP-dependent enzyme [Rhizohabitans arisaemae]
MTVPPAPIEEAAGLFTLDPGKSHLNNGSFGTVPVPVQRRHAELRAEMEADTVVFFRGLTDRIAAARAEVAAFLDADPAGLAFTANVTEGVAVALASLPLGIRDEILITDHCYGAVQLAVRRRAEACGAKVGVAEVARGGMWTGDDAVQAILDAVTPRTRVAVFDHVTSATARLMPVHRLVTELRARGVTTVVDGAHVPGMLPVSLNGIGADFWTGNLHKWGFAPRSTGVLAVSPEWRARVRPLIVSWFAEEGFPVAIESQGTRDHTGWLAAPYGLRLIGELGAGRIRRHNAELAEYGQRLLAEATGLAAWPGDPELAMRVVRLPQGMARTFEAALALAVRVTEELGCHVAIRPWQGAGLVRLSAQIYNRPDEYQRFATGFAGILRNWV